MIDKIVDNKNNPSRFYRYDKASEPLYSVPWYSYDIDDEKWNPTQHLPYCKILPYNRKNRLPILDRITQPQDG